MDKIYKFIDIYNMEIILGLILTIIILFILFLTLSTRLSKIKYRYRRLVRGVHEANIEQLLLHNGHEIDKFGEKILEMDNKLKDLDKKLTFAIQKVGFIRYNAFANIGSELSFSIAFLDNFLNGFVLTSIYGREQSTCYAKYIRDGKSLYPLSAEEIQAIDRAIKGEFIEKTM